jgi:hypothetical protein
VRDSSDCGLNEFANVECFGRFLGEHVKELLGIRGLIRATKILVAEVQLRSDVVQSDAAISKTLSQKHDMKPHRK